MASAMAGEMACEMAGHRQRIEPQRLAHALFNRLRHWQETGVEQSALLLQAFQGVASANPAIREGHRASQAYQRQKSRNGKDEHWVSPF
ncbi:MAG: hypothetical protein AAFY47_09930 [Pseudomonadota bacterium]